MTRATRVRAQDALLRRVAKLFDEYKGALREAQFCAVKKTVAADGAAAGAGAAGDKADGDEAAARGRRARGGGKLSEIVEVISKSEGMDRALKGLDELLHNFLKVDTIDVSFKQSFTHSFTHLFTYSLIHSTNYLLTITAHSLTHSLTHSFTHSLLRLLRLRPRTRQYPTMTSRSATSNTCIAAWTC